ncbi:hypothetical protein BDV28DRAFT_132310 [Aspergillus coremiiformis]|uniref:Uncharacterized protein n=1 Tax=Aspergillus coremiiformis TaxID=138285 RepID=A0A5N6Z846_9EURO|nr:hypothetical protein BDV28DRAFT_132310 [Aspergillus coremiiformis]
MSRQHSFEDFLKRPRYLARTPRFERLHADMRAERLKGELKSRLTIRPSGFTGQQFIVAVGLNRVKSGGPEAPNCVRGGAVCWVPAIMVMAVQGPMSLVKSLYFSHALGTCSERHRGCKEITLAFHW